MDKGLELTGKAYQKMASQELDARWGNVSTLVQSCLKVDFSSSLPQAFSIGFTASDSSRTLPVIPTSPWGSFHLENVYTVLATQVYKIDTKFQMY